MILRDGTAPAEKEKAAVLFENILPSDPANTSVLNLSRAATSIALITAYISGPAERSLNHWSLFEYWVMAGAYILRLVEASSRAEKECQISFEICELAAENALKSLAEECSKANHFVQGLPLIDGHVYRTRMVIILGLLCGLELSLRVRGKPAFRETLAFAMISARLKEAVIWGEAAVPLLFAVMLLTEQNCNSFMAEGIAIQLIRDISTANGEMAVGRGAPNPYIGPEEALRLSYGLEPIVLEQFTGLSYSIAALVDFLARRLRRQALSFLWFGITRISMVESVPEASADFFRWISSKGKMESRLAAEPQSWQELREAAKAISLESLPSTLRKRPAFALWFIMVFPHRFTRATAKLIEEAIFDATKY